MPLPYETRKPLSLPASLFNDDGLAVLLVQGGRYGGDWVISAARIDSVSDVCGEMETSAGDRKDVLLPDPGYPWRALETAFIWLAGEAKTKGWRLVAWQPLMGIYGPDEAPYFCAAQAIVASEAFVPAEGVTYADEQTLDAVMGYSS